jgi:DNA-binding protein HU-beta
MNKNILIENVYKRIKDKSVTRKQVESVFENIFKEIVESLQRNEEVNIVGFGTFLSRIRHSRNGVNPKNPSEKIIVPEVKVAKFKTGKMLKDALKNKR